MRIKIPPHMRKFKVMKHKRVKHNPDTHIVPLLPLEAVAKLKRGVRPLNKKRYVRKTNKKEIEVSLDD